MTYTGTFWSAVLRALLSLRRDKQLNTTDDEQVVALLPRVESNEVTAQQLAQLCDMLVAENTALTGQSLLGYLDFNKMGAVHCYASLSKDIRSALSASENITQAWFQPDETLQLCTDESVIGTWFYVMEMVEGRIFWDATVPGVSNEERATIFDAMNATIAQLHSYDPETIGLGDYGKPGNYFARQVGRWSRQYREDEAAGRDEAMDAVIEWLEANMPEDDGASSVIHGDFRIDNMIFHPTEPRVLAVLDWELSTLGHPLADFAYHAMMYHMPPHIVAGLGGADIDALGIPSEEDYVAAYCRRTGREGLPDYRYYLAFNFFRLAAIFHGIKGRVIRGTAANAQAKERAEAFPELARLALGFTDA